jgi:hypothetical protein
VRSRGLNGMRQRESASQERVGEISKRGEFSVARQRERTRRERDGKEREREDLSDERERERETE